MKFDPERFEPFLAMLPRDTEEASRLAREHDAKRPLRHAVEIRHESFCTGEFIELLRRQDVAMVCADTPEWPLLMDLTADFVYCRLHGSGQLYTSGYDATALDRWAERIRIWAMGGEPADANRVLRPTTPRAAGRDVYVYFDNDAKVHAPFDAAALAARLGIGQALKREKQEKPARRKPPSHPPPARLAQS